MRQLKSVRAASVALSVDIRSSTADILENFTDAQSLRRRATEWRERADRDESAELAEEWLWELRERATRLAALEERVRGALQTDAALLSAIANLRIQRWLLPATLGALLVAVVSLIVALSH